jgi:Flp pilus assembly pilin Flp
MLERLRIRLMDEVGQTFVEYALLLAVVVVGALLAASWTSLGTAIQGAISAVGSAV